QKQGANMMQVASTTALNYTFSGLQLQDTQWVSVAPIINGSNGIRALAISKQADSGTCATAIPGDLHLLSIDAPVSGREWTQRQLSSHENLSLRIQNQDAATATQYRISYRVNGGSWQSQIFTNS